MLKNSTARPDRLPQPIADKSIAAGFHAFSDPLRLQILELLREQELCVCDLCDRLGVPQSKLSFHLKTLKEAALVRSRQEGRWIYYSLNLAQFLAPRTVPVGVPPLQPNPASPPLSRRGLTYQYFLMSLRLTCLP